MAREVPSLWQSFPGRTESCCPEDGCPAHGQEHTQIAPPAIMMVWGVIPTRWYLFGVYFLQFAMAQGQLQAAHQMPLLGQMHGEQSVATPRPLQMARLITAIMFYSLYQYAYHLTRYSFSYIPKMLGSKGFMQFIIRLQCGNPFSFS